MMKSSSKHGDQLVDMAALYQTHHLTMDQVWHCRERPWSKPVIEVKRAVADVDRLEGELEKARQRLEEKVAAMEEARKC